MKTGFLVMPTALGAQLLGTFLVACFLGPDQFGIFALIFAIMSVANFVTEMGMGTIITKLVAEGKRPAGHFIGLALPVVSAACVVVAGVLVAIVWLCYPADDVRWAGLLAGVNIVVFGTSMVLSSTLRGLSEMGKWMAGFLGQKLLFLILTLVGSGLLDGGLVAALAAWTLASAVVAVYYLLVLWGRVWHGRLVWDYPELRALVRESIPVGLISAANQFGMQLDMFVLALLLTDRDVGLYALGQRMLNPARNILHGAVSAPTFPGLCRTASADRPEFIRQAHRLCVVQWIAGLPLVVLAWVAAPWLIPRLLPEFDDSVRVIWITVWALAPACLTLQLRYIYTAMSGQGRFLRLNVIHLAIKCILLIILTRRFGIIGACYGTVIAELVFALLTRYGLVSFGVTIRLFAGVAMPTIATGIFLGALWMIGLNHWLAPVLGAGHVLVSAFFINRLLKGLRERKPA